MIACHFFHQFISLSKTSRFHIKALKKRINNLEQFISNLLRGHCDNDLFYPGQARRIYAFKFSCFISLSFVQFPFFYSHINLPLQQCLCRRRRIRKMHLKLIVANLDSMYMRIVIAYGFIAKRKKVLIINYCGPDEIVQKKVHCERKSLLQSKEEEICVQGEEQRKKLNRTNFSRVSFNLPRDNAMEKRKKENLFTFVIYHTMGREHEPRIAYMNLSWGKKKTLKANKTSCCLFLPLLFNCFYTTGAFSSIVKLLFLSIRFLLSFIQYFYEFCCLFSRLASNKYKYVAISELQYQ